VRLGCPQVVDADDGRKPYPSARAQMLHSIPSTVPVKPATDVYLGLVSAPVGARSQTFYSNQGFQCVEGRKPANPRLPFSRFVYRRFFLCSTYGKQNPPTDTDQCRVRLHPGLPSKALFLLDQTDASSSRTFLMTPMTAERMIYKWLELPAFQK
jgi:hypothetical protein